MDDDLAAAAVDGGDHPLGADGVGQRLGEVEIGPPVLEQRRAGDDLLGAGGEDLLRALDRSNAAADAAGQRRRDLADDREVVAGAHRGVEVDDLHLREPLEPAHPLERRRRP